MARYNVPPSKLGRYYFFECDRFLRYSATRREHRAEDGVPTADFDLSPVTHAILATGQAWEHAVLTQYLPDAVVGEVGIDGTELTDRVLGYEQSISALRDATPGTAIYQPTLRAPAGFYERYGLDPQLVGFGDFRPDLLMVDDWGEGLQVRVVDLKATDHMKLSHRVQVGIYTLLLDHVLAAEGVPVGTSRQGGVWLYQAGAPEWFPLSGIVPPIETFLERELTPLLSAPAPDAAWHLYFRCEWCDYYSHCRAEAEATDDVSLVPYLSHFAKRHLVTRAGVRTVADFAALLDTDDADESLRGCASLEGRRGPLSRSVEALRSGVAQPTGAHSAALPKSEGVRLLLTLQEDPLSGAVFGYAVNRVFGKDVFGDHNATVARVAADGAPATLAALRADLVGDLIAILRPVHEHNAATDDWWAQLSVQAYVFDSYERDLLVTALLTVIEEADDLELVADALALLFHFQHPDLAGADDQPAKEVLFPLVVLTQAIRSMLALPIPVTYRFSDVVAALQPTSYGFAYAHHGLFDFELSNRMRADAILQAWNGQRADRLDQVTGRLKQRVWAANSVLGGLREQLEGELFAYPPKFFLPASFAFDEPLLSRLAFIAQYEKVLGYLDTRSTRMRSEAERLAAGDAIELTRDGGSWYALHPRHADDELKPDDFAKWLFTCDTEAGRQARLAYDEFRGPWPPKNKAAGIAQIRELTGSGRDRRLRLDLQHRDAFVPPDPGQRCLLEPVFTDWTTQRVIEALRDHDAADGSWFVELLRDPLTARQQIAAAPELRDVALQLAADHGMTPSQLEAFTGAVDHDVQLVWGPPGTGKTHFLALAILALAEAHARSGRPLRVLVTAMTHAALDNLLGKLVELQRTVRIVSDGLWLHKLNASAGEVGKLAHRDAPAWADEHAVCVIGSTVWQARKIDPDALRYDLVVIDEGSQVKVGEAAIPLLRLADEGRLLIAGDDKQLPPIVRGAYPEVGGEPLLHRSILECLRTQDPDDELTAPLLENWRMCDVLCEYPAASLYPAEYAPATDEIAARRLPPARAAGGDQLAGLLLDPAYPLVVAVLEDVAATAENRIEAALVVRAAAALRERYPDEDDEAFWSKRLFIVSPHHAQIRAIRTALDAMRDWAFPPLVGTVDKMQGQECDAVIVSYGVSDVEYALGERDFIYSLNRLNVAITRARAKSIVFLPRPLLQPPIQALDSDHAAEGVAYMQGLANWCNVSDQSPGRLDQGRLTILRRGSGLSPIRPGSADSKAGASTAELRIL